MRKQYTYVCLKPHELRLKPGHDSEWVVLSECKTGNSDADTESKTWDCVTYRMFNEYLGTPNVEKRNKLDLDSLMVYMRQSDIHDWIMNEASYNYLYEEFSKPIVTIDKLVTLLE